MSLPVRPGPIHRVLDYSYGIINGQTDKGIPMRHLRRAVNVTFDKPFRGLGCRLGFRDISDYTLSAAPHSLMKYYSAGGNKLFVGAGTKIYQVTEVSGYLEQTLPVTPNSNRWSHANINGMLVCQQEGGTNPPIFYNGTAWLSCVMPAPTPTFTVAGCSGTVGLAALTSAGGFGSVVAGMAVFGHANIAPNTTVLSKTDNSNLVLSTPIITGNIVSQPISFAQRPTFAADSGGGSVDAGDHLWRVRWLFANGGSIASVASAVKTVAGPNNTVNLIVPRRADRSDYLGFQIERTKVGFPAVWYLVGTTISTSATTFQDSASDASLGTRIAAEPGPYASAPTIGGKYFDGIAAYREILFGWIGTNLYWGRNIGDSQAAGAGCFNFHPFEFTPVNSEDGDPIVQCLAHGDALAIGKGQAISHLIGYDRDSFRLIPTYRGVGFASTRGAAAHGPMLFWYGGLGRTFRMVGGQVMQIGDRQVGDYLDEMDYDRDADVVMKNYGGRKLLMAYTAETEDENGHILAMRFDNERWEHYEDMRAADMLVQNRRDDFAKASLIFADPKIADVQLQSSYSKYPSYVAWIDDDLSPDQVRIQKYSDLGVEQWAAGGVLVTASANASGLEDFPQIIPLSPTLTALVYGTEHGTAVRTPYIQFFDDSGTPLLSGEGLAVPIAALPSGQVRMCACRASATKVWVAFFVNSGPDAGQYVERITSAGVREMVPNTALGRRLSSLAGARIVLMMQDGAGGFYANMYYNNGLNNLAYQINSSGDVVAGWPENTLNVTFGDLVIRKTLRKATNGDLITLHNASGLSIQLRRISPAGVSSIPGPNLLPAWPKPWSGDSFSVLADDENGGYFMFADQSLAPPHQYYLVRFKADGTPAWTNPIVVATDNSNPSNSYQMSMLLPDGAGGAVAIYSKGVESGFTRRKIYAQRFSKDGVAQWLSEVVVCEFTNPATADQKYFESTGWATVDGSGGVLVALTEEIPGAIYKLQRINGSGERMFGVNGKTIDTMASSLVDDPLALAFLESFDDGLPVGAGAGYHLWSAFDGFLDFASRDGSGGAPVRWRAETPAYDDGTAEVKKEFDELRVLVTKGISRISATVTTDDGSNAAVQLSPGIGQSSWGDSNAADLPSTMYWGPATGANPSKRHSWGGSRSADAASGLPDGTIGKSYALTLSAEVSSEHVVAGHTMDYRHLSDREID